MKTVGIVLAAGASRRMGSPKALLRGADGAPLAARQAASLRAGGCEPVAVVLGSEIERIRRELPPELATAENPSWAQGRASSLQAGIAAYPEADGYLFLPVDAVGARPATVRAVLAAAAQDSAAIWRPAHRGAPGHLLWLPRAAARKLLALPADARVDEWARARSRTLEVDDPAILRNVNTPAEWAALQDAP
ncbi:MAG TPA: nucleotidyltransferase family protein [Kiritimatiellia bacterium]|nr:nucleotidyltransferase family protein [Kiritimatiellia bacterium]